MTIHCKDCQAILPDDSAEMCEVCYWPLCDECGDVCWDCEEGDDGE
jgi:hypothetical protein